VNLSANGGFEQWAVAGHAFENIGGVIAGTVTNSATGAGLAGWTVFIDTTGTGQLTPGAIQTTTDSNGNYVFTGLATDVGAFSTYTIVVVPPSGWVAATNNSITFDLSNPNQTVTGADFSFTQLPIGPHTGPA
jgi:hypothetical protein